MNPEEEMRQATLMAATILATAGIKCPTCPACGGSPQSNLAAISWPGQAMCGNEDCAAIMWAPLKTAREQLADAQHVDLEES